jgi:hypothetical protein
MVMSSKSALFVVCAPFKQDRRHSGSQASCSATSRSVFHIGMMYFRRCLWTEVVVAVLSQLSASRQEVHLQNVNSPQVYFAPITYNTCTPSSEMQASTSRAALAQLTRVLNRTRSLPPCTCGALPQPLRRMTTSAAHSQQSQTPASTMHQDDLTARRMYAGPSQADRLAAKMGRTSIFLEGLCPWVTPRDVRRLLSERLGHDRDVNEGQFCDQSTVRDTSQLTLIWLHSRHATSDGFETDGQSSCAVYLACQCK